MPKKAKEIRPSFYVSDTHDMFNAKFIRCDCIVPKTKKGKAVG